MSESRERHSPLLDAGAADPPDDREPPTVCRKLRTKMAFGALQGVEDWRHGDSSHPHDCQRGRLCFEPPDGGDLVALADDRDRSPGRAR